MKPAARLQAAIELYERLAGEIARGRPVADRLLAEWGRGARYAGSKDRRAVADRLYLTLRRRGSYAYAMGCDPADGRAIAAASLLDEGVTPEATAALFDGSEHGPAPLAASERAALDDAPARLGSEAAILEDFPEWLRADLADGIQDPARAIKRLRERGAADLRVNRLKTTPGAALDRLAAEGLAAAAGPLSPDALRLEAGATALTRLGAYREGWVEIQDAASQATALLAGARPGEAALDYCAGGGGKTLALGATMAGAGRLVAHDVEPARMADLPARLARAGGKAEILSPRDLAAETNGFDLVFVDAPCSGSGAWARNPDAKWALTPERLAALHAAQEDAIENAAAYVRPGGRLVYVTCSILASENKAQAEAFRARRPDFSGAPLEAAWRDAGLLGDPPAGCERGAYWAQLSPDFCNSDGFFVALFRRNA